jgi:hypothetical protein
MSLAGHAALTEEMRNAYTILFGRTEERRPLERLMFGWENNTYIDIS